MDSADREWVIPSSPSAAGPALPDSLRFPRAVCGDVHPRLLGQRHDLVCDKPAGHTAHRDSVRDPGCAWQPDIDGMVETMERLTADLAAMTDRAHAAERLASWLDVTRLGDPGTRERCNHCGTERLVPRDTAGGNSDA